jgi:2-methylisocitrate lyase-like PEP mutase family enzyme
MSNQRDLAKLFMDLHHTKAPLLLPNPWDIGSALILESLGFEALATTSSGFAATLGRLDGSVGRDEAIRHAASIVAATSLPVSADLENGFADDPAGVADTVGMAIDAGLAGCSVEDFSRNQQTIYDLDLATERVAAAAAAAHAGDVALVLTARSENYLHGKPDLDDTIARLKAFESAGADVLFAPGIVDIEEIRRLVSSVDRPVNVLAFPGGPTVAGLAAAGVKRVSVGGALAFAALGAVVTAARELLDQGTFGFIDQARAGAKAFRASVRT